MRNTEKYIKDFQEREGGKGTLLRRLFASIQAGFRAADLDLEALTQQQEAQQQEIAALRQEVAALRAQLQEALSPEGALLQNLESLNVNMRSNNTQLEALRSDSELQKVKLARLERHAAPVSAPASGTPVSAAPPAADSDYNTIDYFDFENHFRGSIEHIKDVQRMYLPYFSGKQNVLDLGCGRGEFLSLLKEEGIPAKGVDVYEPYADYCRMQGLDAVCGDGIAMLQQMDSVDGIFVGQVVEHLKTAQIVALCNAAYEKLPEGGCIVIETPNPTSLAIYTGAFYIDPSHVKPVHPLTMQYFLEKAGFSDIEILYPEQSRPPQRIPVLHTADAPFNAAMQQVADVLFGSQDYAVIAKK